MRSERGNLRGTLCRQGRYSLMLVATVSDGYTYNLSATGLLVAPI
jgi:hypothetical protein